MSWSVEDTALSDAPPGAVWDLWADVAHWPSWNPTIAEASLDGPFAEGTSASLKPAKGPRSRVILRDISAGACFAAVSKVPGAQLRIEHEVAGTAEGQTRVTERAVLAGPLERLWVLVLGRQLERDMRAAVLATAGAANARRGAG